MVEGDVMRPGGRMSLLSISQPALSQLPWCPFVINPTFIAYPAWDSQSRVPWGWKNPEAFKKIISPQLSVVKIICTAFSRVILQLQNVSVPLARVTYTNLNLDRSSYLRDFPRASQVSPVRLPRRPAPHGNIFTCVAIAKYCIDQGEHYCTAHGFSTLRKTLHCTQHFTAF